MERNIAKLDDMENEILGVAFKLQDMSKTLKPSDQRKIQQDIIPSLKAFHRKAKSVGWSLKYIDGQCKAEISDLKRKLDTDRSDAHRKRSRLESEKTSLSSTLQKIREENTALKTEVGVSEESNLQNSSAIENLTRENSALMDQLICSQNDLFSNDEDFDKINSLQSDNKERSEDVVNNNVNVQESKQKAENV